MIGGAAGFDKPGGNGCGAISPGGIGCGTAGFETAKSAGGGSAVNGEWGSTSSAIGLGEVDEVKEFGGIGVGITCGGTF